MNNAPTVRLLGIDFACLSPAAVCDAIADRAGKAGGTVVTANVDHIVLLRNEPEFAAAYQDAWLRVMDGAPLIGLSRLLGLPLRERVTGSDLMPRFCTSKAASGLRVAFVGGHEGSAAAAALRFQNRADTTVEVVGAFEPRIEVSGGLEDDTSALLQELVKLEPDVVFLGLGSPKQELWAMRHGSGVPATVFVCCGAAIDFAGGVSRRAPHWVRRLGLEWLYRLMREPRRLWRRYLINDSRFLMVAVGEIWRAARRQCR